LLLLSTSVTDLNVVVGRMNKGEEDKVNVDEEEFDNVEADKVEEEANYIPVLNLVSKAPDWLTFTCG
jgi:hypothetical protein